MNRRFILHAALLSIALAGCTVLVPVEGSIVDVTAKTAELSTFNTAITTANLGLTLQGAGPFTVFAPTDAAFAALPEDRLARLLAPENAQELRDILTFHVVPGAVMAEQLAIGQLSMATLNGAILPIDGREGIMMRGATVVTTDLRATNGIIHTIDKVLLP